MIRRYHRWLSVVAGLFILWIAVTGSIVQFSRMTAPEQERPAAGAPAPADPDEAAPAAPAKRLPRDSTRQFIHFVTDLHSGATFGLAGQIVSLISGLALIFFAISGLWMYIELLRGRLVRAGKGVKVRGGKYFWK